MVANISPRQLGIALAILAAFGFSFKAIFVKLAYQSAPVDAVTLLSLRMMFSLPLFLIGGFAYLRRGPKLDFKDWLLLVFLGLTGYYGASILDFLGLQYISAGLERIILFTYPTITILIGLLFLGKEVSLPLISALVLCYAGVSLVVVSDTQLAEDSTTTLIGAALVFASAVSYACYNAFSEVSIGKLGAARFSVLALVVSIIAAQVHFLAVNPLSDLRQPLPIYGYCAAMALFSTVMPIFFQSGAIQRIGAGPTVLVGMLGPVMTIFFGWMLLGEPITWVQLSGTALVLVGVYQVRKG
ncbi:DMT family transporter [Marinobacter salinexigens]|uniref:DMT family transporter n=1 Tax=Marinobacter salinexigens TaxID=2919747 RepID=A0A5B0V9N3_9GAMM|nr:DMT family transporter [Marinobacter salinexigens]KAA1171168.1 DMT family transporter [Marinobacter salinexigens]